jgi:hypothetical protein
MKSPLVLVAALTALAAGCGGGGHGSVAVSSPASLDPNAKEAKARQFVQCARQNGVPNVQDPTVDGQGNVHVPPPPGLDQKSAVVQHVLQICGKYMQGVLDDPGQTPQQRHDLMLKYATCIRAHGVPNFPDPDPSSGDIPINKQQLRAAPRFPAASRACEVVLNGGSLNGGR